MNNTINLVDEVCNVIKCRTKIAHLYKNVGEGMIHASKGFINTNNSIIGGGNEWIRLIRLNKMSFKKFIDWKVSYRSRDSDSIYLSIFNKSLDRNRYLNSSTAVWMGVNIDKDIKISGYHYNICDIFNSKLFDKSNYNSNSNEYLPSYIYQLIYVTEKNYLIGFIDNKAILYIDNVLLKKIFEDSYDDFVRIVDRIISVYANANSVFFMVNTQTWGDHIIDKVSSKLVTKLNSVSQQCTIIPPDHIDLFEDNNIVKTLTERIRNMVKEEFDNAIKGTHWGINNQYSYKLLLDQIITMKSETEKRDHEKAFMNGLVYGNKFELAGWSISNREFDGNLCWEKDVDIVPERFFYRNRMYIINASDDSWQNPFRITKLFVTSDGRMFCEGQHPNVSCGKVCMGDISGKIKMADVKKLQSNLAACEQLLTSINYDSPYDSSKIEEMIEHSVLRDMDNQEYSSDSEYIPDGTIIQDVVFEEDPDIVDVDNDSELRAEDAVESQILPLARNGETPSDSNGGEESQYISVSGSSDEIVSAIHHNDTNHPDVDGVYYRG